jgi:hypothetical protein
VKDGFPKSWNFLFFGCFVLGRKKNFANSFGVRHFEESVRGILLQVFCFGNQDIALIPNFSTDF